MRAADLCGMDVVTYFIQGQGPVALCTIASVAIGHFFVQRWFDRREGAKANVENGPESTMDVDKALEGAGPAYYAILPMLPLFLLVIFSPLVYNGIKLSLVTAIIVSLIITLVIDILTRRDFKQCCKDSQAIFEGMGKVFLSVCAVDTDPQSSGLGVS